MRPNVTRQISLFAAAVAIAVWAPPRANAAVITFDSQPVGQVAPNTVITEGPFGMFAFGGPGGNTMTIQNIGGTHQNVAVDGNITDLNGTVFSIFLTGGGLFSLNSFDVANLHGGVGGGAARGCGGGPRIELTDNSGDCFAFLTTSGTFSTLSPSGFQNISDLFVNIVSDVSFADNFDLAVDNFNLTPAAAPASAPEPSTVLLVFAGVAASCFARRRKRYTTTAQE